MSDSESAWPQASGPGQVSLPERAISPWWALSRRLLAALAILLGTVLLVLVDRDGYVDNSDPSNITGVTFSLTPDTATTVKAKITGMAGWANCTGGASPWSCAVSGGAQAAVNLQVAAAD